MTATTPTVDPSAITPLTQADIKALYAVDKGFPDWLVPFMLAYGAMPVMARACRASGISYTNARRYFNEHPEVQQFLQELQIMAVSQLEEELWVRSRISDSLLMFALKTLHPAKFGTKLDVSSDGRPIKTYISISPDDWDEREKPE